MHSLPPARGVVMTIVPHYKTCCMPCSIPMIEGLQAFADWAKNSDGMHGPGSGLFDLCRSSGRFLNPMDASCMTSMPPTSPSA